MIEPAVLVRGAVGKKSQGEASPLTRGLIIDPVPRRGDAQGREPESGRRNAGAVRVLFVQHRTVRPRAVHDESGVGIALLPEIQKRAVRQVVEKLFVLSGQLVLRALRLWT